MIRSNRHLWLHRGVSAFAGYRREQANKYGIKGSRVAASRAATELFGDLMDRHGPQAKVRGHWDAVVALVRNHEHMALVGEVLRGRPEYRARMLDVCNRKVQDRPDALLYVGRSSTHVRQEYVESFLELLDDERGHASIIQMQQWSGPTDAGRWVHKTDLKLPTPANVRLAA